MAFRDILVHVDNSPHCAARIAAAVAVARRHSAHLTGLYVIDHPHYQPEHGHREEDEELAYARFELETTRAGISVEWLCADLNVVGVGVAEIIKRYAFYRDLIIVGQTDPYSETNAPGDLPEMLVATSGRPVLIIPKAGRFNSVGDRVMVAWSSGRESVRALNDALPFLEAAGQAGIMVVNTSEAADHNVVRNCDELCSHLARHDIRAKFEQFVAADVSVGDILLNQAWEDGSDLLVMGAYTHSAWNSMALGKVARHVLAHMTLPVLMSH